MSQNQPAPTVLFVCVSNTGKSVMAQGLMRHAAGKSIHAVSAGTHAKTAVNPVSAQALAELGIDISGHRPNQLDDTLINAADLIVILGTQAHLDPPCDGTPVETWNTDEPSLRGIDGLERMRLIRDDIAVRVTALTQRLRPTSPSQAEKAEPA
ncbi:arsenate-mycothiol transferase ArsC [Mycolicibacter minnesotensis]